MNAIRRSAAVLAAGVLLALAACGGDSPAASPGAPEEPTPSIASEPSDESGQSDGGGEPTKAVPDIPPPDPKDFPGMDQKTDEGAEQAARYFFHVLYWAHQTDGLDEFDALVLKDCKGCKKARKIIKSRADAKSFWSETEVRVGLCGLKYSDEDTREYHCYTTLSAHYEPAYPSEPAEDVKEAKIVTGVQLKWKNDRWLARAFGAAA